jgi:hypothetical protein
VQSNATHSFFLISSLNNHRDDVFAFNALATLAGPSCPPKKSSTLTHLDSFSRSPRMVQRLSFCSHVHEVP